MQGDGKMLSVLKKKLPLFMVIAAVICLVGAILILVIPVARTEVTYKKVFGTMIAVLMILLSGLLALYLWLGRDTQPNFFLFDRNKRKNIPVDELNFKIVNERMNFYMGLLCESEEEVWKTPIIDDKEAKLGYHGVYRPLVAYKMLYDLSDKNLDVYWNYLFSATPATVDSICRGLKQGGETEMVKAFRFLMDNYRSDPAKIKDFVIGNQKYIRGKMLAYIKQHINMFY